MKTDERIKLYFATYGMMKEGVDIPRIGFGIDALPKASAVQAVGRARRVYPGKKRAIWVSFIDEQFKTFRHYGKARRRELRDAGQVTFKTLEEITK